MVLDLEPLFQFSRNNCVAICAFLVPANLLATSCTFLLVFRQRPLFQVRFSVLIAIAFALTLFLHVATWFLIGVITPVTFILAGLGATCILTNLLIVAYRSTLSSYLVRNN